MEKVIIIDNKKLHLVLGNVLEVWDEDFGNRNHNLWSFSLEELLDGTIEINENIWYWLIRDRCYETDIEVINN